jgi:excisionase family DNA binding protein
MSAQPDKEALKSLAGTIAQLAAPMIAGEVAEILARRLTPSPTASSFEALTIEEVQGRLGVSRTTVWRWLKSGRLQSVRIGKTVRIPAASLATLMGATR